MRPIVVVTGRQRPHEVLLTAVSVLVGLAFTLGSPPPGSVVALLPRWEIHVWAGMLLASGLVGVVGLWRWRDVGAGLRLEAAAMLSGSGALLMYVVAVFLASGIRALLAGGFVAAWAVANVWRADQIRRELKGI
jgi:hypothetical protein